MRKLRLGRTGLMVSELGFGGIPIERHKFEEAVAVVRHAFEQGITFYDTGHDYTDSEEKIGYALEPVREKVVIATKTLTKKAKTAERHLNESLERLKTSYIDIYQIHNLAEGGIGVGYEAAVAPGGVYEVFSKARDEGKIRFIGFSSHDIVTAIKACRSRLFDTVQVAFNFIETEATQVLKLAAELDMGMIAMKPLGGGLLQRADLCFSFLQKYPNVVPIPGIERNEELDEIIELYRSPRLLSKADWEEIENIRSELGTKFCHRCAYCMPCDQGVEIYTVMQFPQISRVWPATSIGPFFGNPMKSVDNCTECEECIVKCPYNLQIPETLKENLKLYKDYVKKK
jgi:predicted aldo/keto reductase-like oxidoreductase